MGDTAERLAMPKRQDKPKIEGLQQEPLLKPPVGVPPNPLPVWVALPLDAKLPMIPGPKGSTVLYTTGLGEKIQVSSSEMDFDLTDPYSILMSNNYKPLHDPHLKSFLNAENMQQRLCRGGFITSDGKVICNLKEFNEYRQYLRKIILAMEKMKEQEEGGKPFPTKVKQDNEVIALMKQRGKKVKEVRERLAKQHEEDKRRYIRLKAEEDERRKKLREQFLEKLSTREKSMKERDERRMSLLKRSQMEERRKKLAMMQAWHDNDVKRRNQTEYRQRTRERERQQKLEQSWEERKRIQQRKIDEEKEFREKEDANKKMRIEEREEGLRKQRQRLQGQLKELTEKRRIEKQRLEEIYLAQFKTKVEKQHANSLRARKRKSSKKPSKFRPRSVWDLEKTILEGLGGEGDNLKYARESSEDIKRESLLRLMEDQGYSLVSVLHIIQLSA